jgi:hypothetical protein
MGKGFLRRPSPSMIVALVALGLVVAGGTAVATGKIKLGKNAVKTKNIRDAAVTNSKLADGAVSESKIANGAVSEGKIADGAVSAGKLASSSKTIWAETSLGSGLDIVRQSGGVTITKTGVNGESVVNFGTDVSKRAISVIPLLSLGSIVADYARCTQVSCASSAGSPNAIEVHTFISNTGSLAWTGFAAQASP